MRRGQAWLEAQYRLTLEAFGRMVRSARRRIGGGRAGGSGAVSGSPVSFCASDF